MTGHFIPSNGPTNDCRMTLRQISSLLHFILVCCGYHIFQTLLRWLDSLKLTILGAIFQTVCLSFMASYQSHNTDNSLRNNFHHIVGTFLTFQTNHTPSKSHTHFHKSNKRHIGKHNISSLLQRGQLKFGTLVANDQNCAMN